MDENRAVKLEIRVSPSWAAGWLREHLWSKAWGVALVSATLRALGSFEHYRSLTGLGQEVAGEVFESTLEYGRQARLVVPWMEQTPGRGKQDRAYFSEVARLLPSLLLEEEGGCLVLFNSRDSMQLVYRELPPEFRGQVLMQGNGLTRAALMDTPRERVEAGRASVLFGLASFAEGVDLPGQLCRHLVITRLPFQPFNHPVARNVREWMGNSHFRRFSLPQASIRLIQACGRLLRNEEDHGRITILDRRLLLASYGKILLEHLPAYRFQAENSAVELVAEQAETSAAAGGVLIF